MHINHLHSTSETLPKTGSTTEDLVECAEQQQQTVLQVIASVNIQLTPQGLYISAPGIEPWEPDDAYAESFSELPTAFAKSYLQLRLRNFLLAAFCHSLPHDADDADKFTSESSLPLANDEVGGGLNVGLIQQFLTCNKGEGYFDPGWQVLHSEADGTLALQKQGVTVHVEPHQHLRAEQQSAEVGDRIEILLPSYRYETDDYIAISNLGPIEDIDDAIEIYFAADAAAMAPLMTVVTTALGNAVPYTLRVPHRLKGYTGPEAIALRVNGTDHETVFPVLKNLATLCDFRDECPVFAYPLYPGISWASVAEGPVTQWFGSAADVGRMQIIAEVLVENWYDLDCNSSTPKEQIFAIQTHFTAVGLSWSQPYCHLHQRWTSQWKEEVCR